MTKKVIILFCFVIAIAGGIIFVYYSNDQVDSPILVEHDGMIIRQVGEVFYKQYDNLEDLEKEADLIIIGKPTKNLKTLELSQTKTTDYDPVGEFWVDTPFKVNKVIKGNFEEKEIIIAQPILIDEDQNQVLTLPGYSPLLENTEYVLFLAKSEYGISKGQEYAWNIMSFNHGKYNLDGNDAIEDIFSDEKQTKLKKLVKKKYEVEK